MFMTVCPDCGKTAKPIGRPQQEEQPDGSIKVYGTLCVCACDPRYNPNGWGPYPVEAAP
jgi:hypothetical protein